MKLSDFDYSYPAELVAHYPLAQRDSSRMLVLDKQTGELRHRFFRDFPDYFSEGDILVLNTSRVFPCRLWGKKKTGGKVECLLLRHIESNIWHCMPSKKASPGDFLEFSPRLSGVVEEKQEDHMTVRFSCKGSFEKEVERIGHVPLPPYIKREDDPFDRERYQTIYAQKSGSVAAPTAGFHFTKAILDALRKKGVKILDMTLHVGSGTFVPIRTKKVEDHQMHGEFYEIPRETADAILQAKEAGRKISVVGTTTTRALESAWDDQAGLKKGLGFTEKFIHPPYKFRVVDRLLTNFHQPCSTLLVLVSAFAGRTKILSSYREAIETQYRLFSYGDCMWII